MLMDKRFIEDVFPVREVSFESAREKNIRHGHISTLHIWWARRPLAASRATNFAALIPAADNDEGDKFYNKFRKELQTLIKKHGYKGVDKSTNRDLILKFIIVLCRWENTNDQQIIELARKIVLDANKGVPPKVLDPFGGGGSIPLEALRLGCETYSNDYNPVAVLIQKCTLEYPQMYGTPISKKKYLEERPWIKDSESKIAKTLLTDSLSNDDMVNPLLEDVKYWGNWVLEEAKKELQPFYPIESDGSIPISYIWARTINCTNPSCNSVIPLMRQYWLVKKSNKKISLYPYVEGKKILFKIVGDDYDKMPANFDPEEGTVDRAVAKCLVCGTIVEANETRAQFKGKKSSEKMIAIVSQKKSDSKRIYRIAEKRDVDIFDKARTYLDIKIKKLKEEWDYDPLPNEETPDGKGRGAERAFSVRNYGLNTYSDLFNKRQLLSLICTIEHIANISRQTNILTDGKVQILPISTYLYLGLSRMVDYYNNLCIWDNSQERTVHVYGRQTLPIVWDYSELNPLSKTVGSWESMLMRRILLTLNSFKTIMNPAKVSLGSATELKIGNSILDGVFTDPPYYDNVPYSYLSDLFYVWLKRMLGNDYPELFSTPLSPKKNEIVAYSNIPGGFDAGKKFFEDSLKKSFQRINEELKKDGVSIVVYAHKSTSGWETVINSLLDSNLVITASWPISTEQKVRLRASESAALASSIYIVARKKTRLESSFYVDVKSELQSYLQDKLESLWQEGSSGPDFFIAGIGSAIEVFGKYEKVLDYEGNVVRADRLLDDVREIVTNYAVKQILHNGFSTEISELSRFYVLFRWNYGEAKVLFDEAKKLGQSCGIDIAENWGAKSFIKKDKEFIKVLGPQNRKVEEITSSRELVDVLHAALLLWEKSNRRDMLALLQSTGYGKSEAFFRVAQAVSETLSNESKEKKLLDGFLSGRERIVEEMKKKHKPSQPGLFD